MNPLPSVFCFGEIVWDALPSGIFLGGAPLNVAFHLRQLGRPAFPVSRIGNDFLGSETLRRLKMAGLPHTFVQRDPQHETGTVIVDLDANGDASYEIRKPAAWDFMEPTSALMTAIPSAGALVYGTLALRSKQNAALLDQLMEKVPVRLCDVNLRRPFDDPATALKWAAKATLVKLNDDELLKLCPEDSNPSIEDKARQLAEQLDTPCLIVTRGAKGAFVVERNDLYTAPVPAVEVADTVGAGDAFTAAFLHAYLNDAGAQAALEAALKLGAFVASQHGAQPKHPSDSLHKV